VHSAFRENTWRGGSAVGRSIAWRGCGRGGAARGVPFVSALAARWVGRRLDVDQSVVSCVVCLSPSCIPLPTCHTFSLYHLAFPCLLAVPPPFSCYVSITCYDIPCSKTVVYSAQLRYCYS
jgi:hypothetical protein